MLNYGVVITKRVAKRVGPWSLDPQKSFKLLVKKSNSTLIYYYILRTAIKLQLQLQALIIDIESYK